MTFGLTKDLLLAIDPDTRAFTLVGAFMGHFALLEEGINAALGEVLEVKGIRRAIVARNMSFDDKIKTLRTLVNTFILNQSHAKDFDDLAKRARKIGETRNVVAHTPFRRSAQSDGVEFFAFSASSTLKFIEMDWPIDEFLRQVLLINEIDNELRSIDSKMAMQRVAQALINGPGRNGTLASDQMGGLFGLREEE